MDKDIDKIEKSFTTSFINNDLIDVSIDVSESVIDSLVDNELLKEIPVLKTVLAVGKTILGIRLKSYTRKLIKLLFYTKDMPSEDKRKFIESLNVENDVRPAEILLQLLDSFENDVKVKILSNLISAKINNNITNIEFLRMSYVVKTTFYQDLLNLHRYSTWGSEHERGSSDILISAGLIFQKINGIKELDKVIGLSFHRGKYYLTDLGNNLFYYGIKDII